MISDKNPDLKVGDFVKFEISPLDKKNQPRWRSNEDQGPSGIWAKGEVVFADNVHIRVSYGIDGYIGHGSATWPNKGHVEYIPHQWERDGYLKKVSCDCGSESVYGKNSLHSRWCSVYNWSY